MTKDATEVAELLRETIKEQNNANNCKEKKENENEDADEKNTCNVDSVKINKLDKEIRKHAENDKSDDESMNKIAQNIKYKENMQKDSENNQEMKEDEENMKSSDCSNNHSSNHIDNYGNCDEDLNEEEFYSNSDLEASVMSTFEKWLHRNAKKWKEKDRSLSE